jgi:hypothetical protein
MYPETLKAFTIGFLDMPKVYHEGYGFLITCPMREFAFS